MAESLHGVRPTSAPHVDSTPHGPRVVLVTGSSRGIGHAICVAFAREKAIVVGVARSDQGETKSQVESAGGVFHAIEADLGALNPHHAKDLIARVVSEQGRLDVLVNNAGIIRRAPAIDFSEDDWNAVVHTNLTSPFFLAQAAAKWWITGGCDMTQIEARLKIVFTASLLSFQGGITVPAYAASKHGVAGLTKALSNEWAKERINVNAVAPGYIETENTAALRADVARNKSITERIPEGRWGKPNDIAGTVAFLSSPAADYLNGVVLNVDGGWMGR